MKVNEPVVYNQDLEFDLCQEDGHFPFEYDGELYCEMCGVYLGEIKR